MAHPIGNLAPAADGDGHLAHTHHSHSRIAHTTSHKRLVGHARRFRTITKANTQSLYATVLLAGTHTMDTITGHVTHTKAPRPDLRMGHTTFALIPPCGRLPRTSGSRDPQSGRGHAQETTEEWLRDLPQHVQKAYTTRKEVTQVPVFTRLLQQISYPQADTLHQELSSGFRLMGQLQPGTNWYIRTDNKYLMPKTPEEFAEHNDIYVRQKLQQARVDDHYELMLKEIVQEVAMGRMNGPFTAPPRWGHQTITPSKYPELRLLPIPHSTPAIALAFSIQQTGSDGKEKIRRGEDWRRSGRNATCIMHDQPYRHTPDHFAALAIRSHQRNPNQLLHVWGHDHDGAYRQLPLDRPEQAYVLLHTPDGPTLWSHNVLLFGSSASIWGYNRFGDAMVSVSRLILVCPTMHYVDDYGSTEGSHQADSGFRSFEDFNGALGYNMKTSERQPPAPSHKIQGVIISTDTNHITLTPCPQRVERMCSDITACLQKNTLEPDQARRMAGKCNFLAGRLFGKVGRAPLKAIYARAHSNISHLDKPTKSALYALLDIIQHCKPLQIQHRHFTIIYTDAYYIAGGAKLRPGDEVPVGWQPTDYTSVENGWGAVIFPPGQTDRAWYFQGRLPQEILKQFSSNTAFI